MDTLLKIGVAGATPFVLQFLMDYITNGNSGTISMRTKMTLAVATGAVLGILIQLYKMSLDPGSAEYGDLGIVIVAPSILGWFFITLNGAISGAVATAGVALAFKLTEKMAGPTNVENVEEVNVRVSDKNEEK